MFFTKQDWIIKQIQNLVRAIAALFFGVENLVYEIEDEEDLTTTDQLYKKIQKLIKNAEYQEAEQIIIENVDPSNLDYLKLVLQFYNIIDSIEEEEMEKHNFDVNQAKSNLLDIAETYMVEHLISNKG